MTQDESRLAGRQIQSTNKLCTGYDDDDTDDVLCQMMKWCWTYIDRQPDMMSGRKNNGISGRFVKESILFE